MRPRPYACLPGSRGIGSSRGRSSQSGAALLLSLLILIVLVAIVIQINVGVSTDARVARNDIGLTGMDLAVESAFLQVDDQLLQDAQNAEGASQAGGTGAAGTPAPTPAPAASSPAAAAGAPGAANQACDSRKDEWARPQRTTLNEIKLRISVQDEDSKINVLNMLNPDEKEAQAAFDRVVKVLDLCREGTQADIDAHTADQMARAMLEYMKQRKDAKVPRPALLSDDTNNPDVGLPLSLKEFACLPPFDESHFRDFRDGDGKIVHSIGSFLTVWNSVATSADAARLQGTATTVAGGAGATGTSGSGSGSGSSPSSSSSGGGSGSSSSSSSSSSDPSSGSSSGSGSGTGSSTAASASGTPGAAGAPGGGGAGGQGGGSSIGGYAVNVNTAPVAVLKSLFDDHDLHPRFFDAVIEYRNLEEEKSQDAPPDQETPPQLDEFGREIKDCKIFDTLAKLSEVRGYSDLPTDIQGRLNQLLTVQSNVFSIFIVARRSTSVEGDNSDMPGTPAEIRAREEAGDTLLRVVRSVVWRHKVDDEWIVTPIVRWELLDYVPFEVEDYPDENR